MRESIWSEIKRQFNCEMKGLVLPKLPGIPPYLIFKNVKAAGFHQTGNNAIFSILKNCVYAGLIKVPEFKELPEKYVKAIHEPIISENEYWLVQGILAESKRKTRIQPAEDFPLRGILKCWCGKKMTAGWSKGCRNYYLYYRCIEHTNINIPGNILHEKFDKVLRALSFPNHRIDFLIQILKDRMVEPLKFNHQIQKEKFKELQEVNLKIYRLEEKFMNDEIDSTTYQNWYKKFRQEKALLDSVVTGQKKLPVNPSNELIERVFPKLSKLNEIYDKRNITQKHTLVKALFKDNLSWDDGMFRTKSIDPTFHDNLLKINNIWLFFDEQPSVKSGDNPISVPNEGYFELLERFLTLIEPITEDLSRKGFI